MAAKLRQRALRNFVGELLALSVKRAAEGLPLLLCKTTAKLIAAVFHTPILFSS